MQAQDEYETFVQKGPMQPAGLNPENSGCEATALTTALNLVATV